MMTDDATHETVSEHLNDHTQMRVQCHTTTVARCQHGTGKHSKRPTLVLGSLKRDGNNVVVTIANIEYVTTTT